jgi:hypothetical protein
MAIKELITIEGAEDMKKTLANLGCSRMTLKGWISIFLRYTSAKGLK